jgi:phosphatidylserine/phosphatidylglycerophosphate/cardiolipin synthase-like enzyme
MTTPRIIATSLALALGAIFSSASIAGARVDLGAGQVDVYFAPQDDITLYVVDFINKAQQRVWVEAYEFTSPEVARALAQAKARGLDVRVVLDADVNGVHKHSMAKFLRDHDVPVWLDDRHPIQHQKVLVVDSDRVGFGSANFTRAGMHGGNPAKSNAENFNLFVRVPALAKQYADEFERLQAESSR